MRYPRRVEAIQQPHQISWALTPPNYLLNIHPRTHTPLLYPPHIPYLPRKKITDQSNELSWPDPDSPWNLHDWLGTAPAQERDKSKNLKRHNIKTLFTHSHFLHLLTTSLVDYKIHFSLMTILSNFLALERL